MAETFQSAMDQHVSEKHKQPADQLVNDVVEMGRSGQKYDDTNKAALLADIHAYDPACAVCQDYKGNPDPP